MTLAPKVNLYVIDPIGSLLMGSKRVQNSKKGQNYIFFLAHCIEIILGGKDFMYFPMTNPKFSKIFKITEKTEKFLPIFVLEILELDFWIPGKILSGILVHLFC